MTYATLVKPGHEAEPLHKAPALEAINMTKRFGAFTALATPALSPMLANTSTACPSRVRAG